MAKKILTFLTLLLNLSVLGQSIEDIDNPNLNLFLSSSINKVKLKRNLVIDNFKREDNFKLQEETFYDQEGRIARKINYKPTGNNVIEYIYEGENLNKIKYFKPDGTLGSEVLVTKYNQDSFEQSKVGKYNYIFDSKGNIISKSILQYDSLKSAYVFKKLDAKEKLLANQTYTFNEMKQLIRVVTDSYIITYQYDFQGNIANKTIRDKKGKLRSLREAKYDNNNFLTQTIDYSYQSKRIWPYRRERISQIVKYEYEYF